MNFSLIVPIAADKQIYDCQLPPMFSLNKEGISFCIKAIMGLNLEIFDNIYFVILGKHDEKYGLCDFLNLQFKKLGLTNAQVVSLDEPTRSQAETVYKAIKCMNINGSIYIKDADSYFEGIINEHNCVAVYPLEKLNWVNPRDKSYVAVDDMFYVTNIIEKRIVSHFFSAGGYGFEDSELFCLYYEKLNNKGAQLYLSHIIYSMLLDNIIYRPIIVNNYVDFEMI